MRTRTFRVLLCAALGILAAGTRPGVAQYLTSANPADRGDARTSLVNPAIATMQDRVFTVGSRILYFGVSSGSLDLRHSYFSMTSSRNALAGIDELGFGLQGQVLQTPMFNAVALNGVLAKQWYERLAVGVNIGVANRAFDRNTFLLEAEDDPLLANLSKWIFPDIGLGVVAVPSRYLTLGLSLNHLTRPNLALSDSLTVRMPHALNAGVAVGWGFFQALFSLSYEDQEWLPRLTFETFREGLGYVRAGFGREAAVAEAKVNVMEGVALNLRYSYPLNELNLASSGSPELGLVFNFDKNSSLYAMEWLEPVTPRRPAISLAHAFLVHSIVDTLLITENHITQKIDTELEPEALADFPRDIFYFADNLNPQLPAQIYLSAKLAAHRPRMSARKLLETLSGTSRTSAEVRVPQDSLAIIEEMQKNHTTEYLVAFRDFGRRMNRPDFQGTLIVPPDARRAHLLLRYVSLYGELSDRIQVVVDSVRAVRQGVLGARQTAYQLLPDTTLISFSAPVDTFKFALNLEETRRWGPVSGIFVLEDARGRIYLNHSVVAENNAEHNQILRRYVWDWKLPNGDYIPAGNYYYYVKWMSAEGKTYQSPKSRLTVRWNRVATVRQFKKKKPELPAKTGIEAIVRLH